MKKKMKKAPAKRNEGATVRSAADYLKLPYGRTVIPESDGTFRAEIREFPGCIATGNSEAEALARVKDVAESWIEAAIELGQSIPEPYNLDGYSGKFVQRMGRSLHKTAAYLAEQNGVSLNSFINNCVAICVGQATERQRLVTHPLLSGRLDIAVQFSTGVVAPAMMIGQPYQAPAFETNDKPLGMISNARS